MFSLRSWNLPHYRHLRSNPSVQRIKWTLPLNSPSFRDLTRAASGQLSLSQQAPLGRRELRWCMIVISEACAHSAKRGPWLISPCAGATDSRQDDHFSSPSLFTGNFHVVNRGIDSGLRSVCPRLSLSSGGKIFAESCASLTWGGEPSKQYCDALIYNLCITFILSSQNELYCFWAFKLFHVQYSSHCIRFLPLTVKVMQGINITYIICVISLFWFNLKL